VVLHGLPQRGFGQEFEQLVRPDVVVEFRIIEESHGSNVIASAYK
jgi:hypothetical protein